MRVSWVFRPSVLLLSVFVTLPAFGAERTSGPRFASPPSYAVANSPQSTRRAGPVRRPELLGPQGGLPNLAPFAPPAIPDLFENDWPSPLVISDQPGTNTDAAGYMAGETLFLDWAVINNGGGSANQRFFVDIVINGESAAQFFSDPPLDPDFFVFVEDVEIGPFAPGEYLITLVADSDGDIIESSENDNTFSRLIQVTGEGAPNLRPFRPQGWDAEVVLSTQAGDNRDAEAFTTVDTIFLDWSVINDGTGPTSSTFFTTLFLDGVEVQSWFSDPPLDSNTFVFIEDFQIGPLAAGVHTVRLVTDSNADIDEIDEGDNEFVRQFTVGSSTAPDPVFIYFPSLKNGPGENTGIAVANPTDEPAQADIFLFSDPFQQLASASLSIPVDGQDAFLLDEIGRFGDAGKNVDAWAFLTTDNLGLAGFALNFKGGAEDIDGAEAVSTFGDSLIFPEILSGEGEFTEIHILGAGRVDVELRDADGTVLQTRRVDLPTDRVGRFHSRVDDLFTVQMPDQAYVLARGLDFLILGYETFGEADFLGGRNAIRTNERGRDTGSALFGAQLAEVAALESLITIINPTVFDADLTLQAFATGVNPNPVATTDIELRAGEMVRATAGSLLGLDNLPGGWLRVDSSVSGIVGTISFGDPLRTYLASVDLQRSPAKRIVSSHVAIIAETFFTGLTFLSTNEDPTDVLVEVFSPEAVKIGEEVFTLQPGEHRARLVGVNLVPGIKNQNGGYIKITSELPIFAFELFSRLASATQLLSLAAVPPQRGLGILEGQIQAPVVALGREHFETYPQSRSKGVELVTDAEFRYGEAVVKLRPDRQRAASRWAQAQGASEWIEGGGVGLLRVPSAERGVLEADRGREETLRLIEVLNADPDVLYAEPNYIYRAFRVPNDIGFSLQWHYNSMNLPAAWDITVGSANTVVAVIDSGAKFGHSELGSRLTGGQMDFVSDRQTSLDGDGIDASAEDPGDDPNGVSSSYHGTHVAGTIGAATDNGAGIAGVNWNSPLMTLRALGARGSGSTFDIAQSVLYAARIANASGSLPPRIADVINMSLGGFGRSRTLADAVAAALGKNVSIVAAAGNENTDRAVYPASFDNVISVGATGIRGRAPYSNFGPRLDVMASGGNLAQDLNGDNQPDGVLSTLWRQSDDTPAFAFYEGTSMASPHVAGIASLMLAVNPSLTPVQIRQILKDTAIDLGVPGRDNTFGSGLVDALEALKEAGGAVAGPPNLVASPMSLAFGTGIDQLTILTSNGGGGQLQVQPPLVETDQGSGWLTARLDRSTVVVEVSRAGLPEGDYTGRVHLNSNGGTETVEVRMRVGQSQALDPGEVFVLALDPFTFETIGSTSTSLASDLFYRLPPVPAGSYLIAAGTDNDQDDFICDEGEFCGLYPVNNLPNTVEVEANDITSGINFTLQPPQNGIAARVEGADARGFALPKKRAPLPSNK